MDRDSEAELVEAVAHGRVRQGAAGRAGEHQPRRVIVWLPLAPLGDRRLGLAHTRRACSLKGMRWSRPAFMRSAGMVQTVRSSFNSSQRIPRTSPDRLALRINSLSASRTSRIPRDISMAAIAWETSP